jgi:drug/metabolite transporter (DMT)-like permease
MHHLLGQTFALLAALTWATALVLFKRSGEKFPPIALNLYKNAVGMLLLLATLGWMLASDADNAHRHFDLYASEVVLLMLSGIIGIALADTLFFFGLNLIGVGLVAIVDCAYSPFVIFFASLMLCEKLTAVTYIGAALIVLGVFLTSRHTPPINRTRGQIVLGMFLAGSAVGMMAFGIVIAKPILEEAHVIWASTLRLVAGSVLLAMFALLGPKWKEHWQVFRPSRTWWYALPASVLGTYLAMIFWVAGFKYTHASVAAVLNQTSVVFASVLAAIFLKERFGPRHVVAIALALTGVTIIAAGDTLRTLVENALLAAIPWLPG